MLPETYKIDGLEKTRISSFRKLLSSESKVQTIGDKNFSIGHIVNRSYKFLSIELDAVIISKNEEFKLEILRIRT